MATRCAVVGGRRDVDARRGRRAVPLPAPRRCARWSARPAIADVDDARRRRRRRLEGCPPPVRRRRRCSTRIPASSWCSITPVRPHGPVRRSGRPPSSSCRPSRAALVGAAAPDAGPVPGGRAHQRVASAARSRASRSPRPRVARRSAPATASTSTSRWPRSMTIAVDSYAESSLPLLGQPADRRRRRARSRRRRSSRRSTATSGFCTNSRQQFDDFLLLIERPDLLGDDASSRGVAARQARRDEWNDIVHECTTQAHHRRDRRARRRELRIPVAPVLNGETILDCDALRRARRLRRRPDRLVHDARAGRGASTTTTRRRLGRRRASASTPARIEARAPPRPTAPGGDHGRLPLAGCPRARPHRVVGGADRRRRARGARRRRHPRRVDHAARRHAHHRRRVTRHRRRGGSAARTTSCSNTNKRGLTLDLGSRRGHRSCCASSSRSADAVIENFSPRVLGNFGLDVGAIQRDQSRVASSCACRRSGSSGPWRDNVGFAQTMEQVTGLAWITGHPTTSRASSRARATRTRACTPRSRCSSALAERDATGRGCHVEVTMVEGALNAAAELVIEATAYGNCSSATATAARTPRRRASTRAAATNSGSRSRSRPTSSGAALVGGARRARVGARSGARDVRRPARAARPARRAPRGRGRAERDLAEAAELLVAHGVPAGARARPARRVDHPQLHARGFYEEIDHPVVGRLTVRRRCRSASRRSTTLAAHGRADARRAQPRDPRRRPRALAKPSTRRSKPRVSSAGGRRVCRPSGAEPAPRSLLQLGVASGREGDGSATMSSFVIAVIVARSVIRPRARRPSGMRHVRIPSTGSLWPSCMTVYVSTVPRPSGSRSSSRVRDSAVRALRGDHPERDPRAFGGRIGGVQAHRDLADVAAVRARRRHATRDRAGARPPSS